MLWQSQVLQKYAAQNCEVCPQIPTPAELTGIWASSADSRLSGQSYSFVGEMGTTKCSSTACVLQAKQRPDRRQIFIPEEPSPQIQILMLWHMVHKRESGPRAQAPSALLASVARFTFDANLSEASGLMFSCCSRSP